MKKYGLNLRIPAQQKPSNSRIPPRPPVSVFGNDDDDDVETEISRQASKNKALQKVEELHKKALQEDASVFDYDGVYDEMKEKIARPKIQEKTERKSKYIEVLMEKAKQREWEQEIVYERKLLKERTKEDHLYADKEKFITSAYKKKLAEKARWEEEEKLRAIREEQEDVTKKKDISDFYFGLSKNVAFGANLEEPKKSIEEQQSKDSPKEPENRSSDKATMQYSRKNNQDDHHAETSHHSEGHSQPHAAGTGSSDSAMHEPVKDKDATEQLPSATSTSNEQYKRSNEALSAAKERFLARKKAKEQL